ncbi:acyltransferase [Flagellatimonas centrodinii]|uniref:acyltransferase family protein n=1 Tax=Flagellatimonas centrodinii TaxID=2806210 RepID=UPI001FEDFB22|nr:acyltransferase family protein [Flagellatimonas centrodinii]ULQ46705.1 acyltransferase [Flagellatimonas centrodinii]
MAAAALLYLGGEGDSAVRRVLQWRPLVLVGIISYSLYLWHWPLLTIARYSNGMEPIPQGGAWALFLVAMALASASYRYVETPFRKHGNDKAKLNGRQHLFATSTAVMGLLGGAAVAVTQNQGWEDRFAPDVLAYDSARYPHIPFKDDCDGRWPDSRNPDCVIGDRDSEHLAILWGDSYALAWAPGLDAMLKAQGLRGILAVNSACPPLLGIHNPSDPGCHDDNNATHDWLAANKPDLIIMAAAWPAYSGPEGRYSIFDSEGRRGNVATFAPAFKRTSIVTGSLGKSVIIIGPTPGAPADIPFKLAVAKTPPDGIRKDDFQRMAQPFWTAAQYVEAFDNIVVIDTMSWFCDSRVCRYLDEQGELLYRDGGHLSVLGADFVVARLLSRLDTGSFYQPDFPSDLE